MRACFLYVAAWVVVGCLALAGQQGLAFAQPWPADVMYGLSIDGKLVAIDLNSYGESVLRDDLGRVHGYEGVTYAQGYFYGVTNAQELIRFGFQQGDELSLQPLLYPAKGIAARRSDNKVFVVVSMDGDSRPESIAELNLNTSAVVNPVQIISTTNCAVGPARDLSDLAFDGSVSNPALSIYNDGNYRFHSVVNVATGSGAPTALHASVPIGRSLAVHPISGTIFTTASSGSSLIQLLEPNCGQPGSHIPLANLSFVYNALTFGPPPSQGGCVQGPPYYFQNVVYPSGSINYKMVRPMFAGNSVNPNKTSGNVVLVSGANISYTSGISITLSQGFEARSGSKFIARVDPNLCTNL